MICASVAPATCLSLTQSVWASGILGLFVFLWDVKRAAANADLAVDDSALPDAARKLLDLLPDQLSEPQKLLRRGFQPFNWLGGKTIGVFSELGAVSQLLAGTAKGGLRAIVAKALIRAVDLIANTRAAGPSALVIVSVVNFLIGAILAFVGAVQLRRFAADIFVANMVGLAVVREMAAVMTAIVMAGRTGGAYAARIATMRGNEELDALEVVGIPLSDYLILPSVLALVFAMPLLYLYGCLVGMFGGFVVSISMLNITSLGYLHQTLDAVPIDQFIFGLHQDDRLCGHDRADKLPDWPYGSERSAADVVGVAAHLGPWWPALSA